MHELSITENILKIALDEAQKHSATKINTIKIKMGELSDILPECINEYLRVISAGTTAENAVLEIEKLPLKVKCSGCGSESSINIRKFRCPVCSGQDLKIIQGREFYIESIEVEQSGDKDCKTDNGVE